MPQGEVRVGRLHDSWLVPLVFTIVFAAGGPVLAHSQSAYLPAVSVSSSQLAAFPPISPPSPRPAVIAKPPSTPGTSEASVLGASTGPPQTFAYGLAAGGGLGSLSDDQLNAELADIKSLGITWVRYDLDWSNIQAGGPGQYDWSDYDRVVTAVRAHGLNSLPILDFTPGWAQNQACSGSKFCEPAQPSAYAAFATAAVVRYSPYGVHTWEIWNEPNNSAFFQPQADPGAYTALLKAAYVAIKNVQGNATIVTGGLAPAGDSGGNLSPPDFVSGMYAAGAAGYFSALGDHPYTWPYSPAYYIQGNAWDQMLAIRALMVSHGDGAKKIWITEFGAPTGGPGQIASSGMTTSEGSDDHVTETLQAKMATDAVTTIAQYPWVGAFFWYSYQDAGTSSDTVENFFGLLRADGTRKPAYYALAQAIAAH